MKVIIFLLRLMRNHLLHQPFSSPSLLSFLQLEKQPASSSTVHVILVICVVAVAGVGVVSVAATASFFPSTAVAAIVFVGMVITAAVIPAVREPLPSREDLN